MMVPLRGDGPTRMLAVTDRGSEMGGPLPACGCRIEAPAAPSHGKPFWRKEQ